MTDISPDYDNQPRAPQKPNGLHSVPSSGLLVKLNIEMTMASLIKKIAQATVSEREGRSMGRYTHEYAGNELTHPEPAFQNGNYSTASARARGLLSRKSNEQEYGLDHIRTTKEVQVMVENVPSNDGEKDNDAETGAYNGFDIRSHEQGGVVKRQSDD